MAKAHINYQMLSWARERSGMTASEFAKKCQVSEEKLLAWEAGTQDITFKQAMKYAEKAHVPFAYLFLATPPHEALAIPDLRTLDARPCQELSAELRDLLKLMLQRQAWYKEYLQQQLAEPNSVVGRCKVTDGVNTIVKDMRQTLSIAQHPQRGRWEDYYRDLVGRIETQGVLVMRQANLGHISRAFDIEEFRGFALSDDYAPIIFINHNDAAGARLFTLIHELCHIWLGQSGISDASSRTQRREEMLCNAVAAEFLVPGEEFSQLWQQTAGNWQEKIPVLEAHFHVSAWVLARRALTLDFISQQDYSAYIAARRTAYKDKESSTGPSYYQTKKAQISGLFSRAVVSEALSGRLLLREAGQLLGGMKPKNISLFAKELGI